MLFDEIVFESEFPPNNKHGTSVELLDVIMVDEIVVFLAPVRLIHALLSSVKFIVLNVIIVKFDELILITSLFADDILFELILLLFESELINIALELPVPTAVILLLCIVELYDRLMLITGDDSPYVV